MGTTMMTQKCTWNVKWSKKCFKNLFQALGMHQGTCQRVKQVATLLTCLPCCHSIIAIIIHFLSHLWISSYCLSLPSMSKNNLSLPLNDNKNSLYSKHKLNSNLHCLLTLIATQVYKHSKEYGHVCGITSKFNAFTNVEEMRLYH